MQIIGDVKNKNVVLIDDIVDTAGTVSYTHLDVYKRQTLSYPYGSLQTF